MCGSDGGSGFVSLAGLIAAKPCLGDMESGRFGSFAAIRCAVIVAAYVLSGGCGRGGFAYRLNSTFSKLANSMICFLQVGFGGKPRLALLQWTAAVDVLSGVSGLGG